MLEVDLLSKRLEIDLSVRPLDSYLDDPAIEALDDLRPLVLSLRTYLNLGEAARPA